MPAKKIPVVVLPDEKWCHTCQSVKLKQRFAVDRSKKDGRNYCCLRCADGKLKEYAERKRTLNATYLRVNGIA